MKSVTDRETMLLRRIRWLTGVFILGLVVSGVTAIPLTTEVSWLCGWLGPMMGDATPLAHWLDRVRTALVDTLRTFPFLFYGTDWLAFGHLMIAFAFVGAFRAPVRNRWLFDFGLIACGLVIPWALVFGAVRGIPVGWRVIDCSFGVIGALPLWWCRRWSRELERAQEVA